MKRWLPSPLLSLSLAAMWLLLNRSLAPGHLLLAAIVAIVMPVLTAPLRPAAGPLHRPLVLARLIARVGADVVVSALQVGRGVLRSRHAPPPHGAFVVIPLELRDPFALASLAIITTVVPGTVWAELGPDRSELLLHVFDLGDEQDFVHFYKTRYELPLKEIFE